MTYKLYLEQFVNSFKRLISFGIQLALQSCINFESSTRCTILNKPLETTTLKNIIKQLISDEAGFIVSAELVLISTIAVLSMIVGLSEVANSVNNELEDVGSAFGRINQSYYVTGISGHKGWTTGSHFQDQQDFCDGENDIVCDRHSRNEGHSY